MKYHISKIKRRSTYKPQEAAELFEVDRKTIFRWIKEGLPLLDPKQSPKLIMGSDLISFLKAKREARRVKLGPHQFYCLRCRKAVFGKQGSGKIEKTGKSIGSANRDQNMITAKCEVCGRPVWRFL